MKILFITGLLRRWRLVFVLFLLVAVNHVVYFAAVNPVAAILNLLLVVLVGSSYRFYFGEKPAAAEIHRKRWRKIWAWLLFEASVPAKRFAWLALALLLTGLLGIVFEVAGQRHDTLVLLMAAGVLAAALGFAWAGRTSRLGKWAGLATVGSIVALALTVAILTKIVDQARYQTAAAIRQAQARQQAQIEADIKLAQYLPQLRGTNADARSVAASTIHNLGPLAEPAIPDLIQVLNCNDRLVRLLAVDTLGKLEPRERPEVTEALTRSLTDPDQSVRFNAALALLRQNPVTTTPLPVFMEVLTNRPPDDAYELWPNRQREALAALSKMGVRATAALPLLRTLTPDLDVQAAIEQIEKAAKPSAPPEAVSPSGRNPPLPDFVRAVALFNEIEDFGHEFDAAFASTNLAAAQTAARRLQNLLTNFNAVVQGSGCSFPAPLFDDVAKVRQALDAGDWKQARQASAYNEKFARAFRRIARRMAAWAAKNEPAAPGRATAPQFGPATETVLKSPSVTPDHQTEELLALDTGAGATNATFGANDRETHAWIRSNRLDVLGVVEKGHPENDTPPKAPEPEVSTNTTQSVAAAVPRTPANPRTNSWEMRLRELNAHGWREAFALGQEVAALPPEEGWSALERNWNAITNKDARQQLLKAFVFAEHPRMIEAVGLALADPATDVQNWGLQYLQGVALRDFSEDFTAAKTWVAQRRGRSLEEMISESARAAATRLNDSDTRVVLDQLDRLRQPNLLQKHPKTVAESGLDQVLERLINSDNKEISVEALKAAAGPPLSEAWYRRVALPFLMPEHSVKARSYAAGLLQQHGGEWAVDPLVNAMTNLVTASGPERGSLIWSLAGALGGIGSPRVIPTLIALIEADNTYDTVYGIGYFGLNKLTGVSYDEKHDGAWWRAWWEKNKQRFPSEVQALEIPRLPAPAEASTKTAARKPNAGAEDVADIPAEQHFAGGDTNKLYFLIGQTNATASLKAGHRLLLVLPGGDGGVDFQPFIKRIGINALPDGYLVAQLVAPKWDDNQFKQRVWPTEKNRYPAMKFSTEEFVRTVVADIEKRHRLDTNRVFTLAWSSGGPAAYAVSLDPQTRVTGSFVAMSVFKPQELPDLKLAQGKAYYLLHSPEDFIPIRFVEQARDSLKQQGAVVQLQTYAGGHGWRGDVFGLIREGIEWLEQHAGKAGAQAQSANRIPKPGGVLGPQSTTRGSQHIRDVFEPISAPAWTPLTNTVRNPDPTSGVWFASATWTLSSFPGGRVFCRVASGLNPPAP